MVFDSVNSEYDKPVHFSLRYAARYCTQTAIRHDKAIKPAVSIDIPLISLSEDTLSSLVFVDMAVIVEVANAVNNKEGAQSRTNSSEVALQVRHEYFATI